MREIIIAVQIRKKTHRIFQNGEILKVFYKVKTNWKKQKSKSNVNLSLHFRFGIDTRATTGKFWCDSNSGEISHFNGHFFWGNGILSH